MSRSRRVSKAALCAAAVVAVGVVVGVAGCSGSGSASTSPSASGTPTTSGSSSPSPTAAPADPTALMVAGASYLKSPTFAGQLPAGTQVQSANLAEIRSATVANGSFSAGSFNPWTLDYNLVTTPDKHLAVSLKFEAGLITSVEFVTEQFTVAAYVTKAPSLSLQAALDALAQFQKPNPVAPQDALVTAQASSSEPLWALRTKEHNYAVTMSGQVTQVR